MTEQYKPWEGKHFKETVKWIKIAFDDTNYVGGNAYTRGKLQAWVEIEVALKKDWDEQGKQ